MIDAVLAVSTLAMASAVAWADWEMSCCGVGSEAHVSGAGWSGADNGQIGKNIRRGVLTKMAVSWEPSVQFASEFDTVYLRVCPTTRWRLFAAMTSRGAYGCAKRIPDALSGRKGRKARKDITWSVPKCVLKCFLV